MKMKKTFELTVIAASLFAALFVGCSNMGAADAGAGLQNAAECGTEGTVTISGALDIGGAAPDEILAAVQNGGAASGASRSAFPQIPATGLEYSVKAVNTADASIEYNGTVTVADDGTLSYTVPIPAIYPSTSPTKQYKTVASVKSNGAEILKGESKNTEYYTLSPSAPLVTNKNVTLSAAQTGSGLLALQVGDPDSKIGFARGVYKMGGMSYKINVTKIGTTWTFSAGVMTDGVLTGGMPAGSRLMTFEFYSGVDAEGEPEGAPLYSFTEAVNVFANLATNKWVQNGNEPWFNTTTDAETGVKTTTCQITAAMIDGFKLTEIYVNPNAADDLGSGSFMHPKKTFSAALGMLQNASADYTIYIKGIVNGAQTIPATINAKSLTLCGANDPDSDGVPSDVINASIPIGSPVPEENSALTIATTVPVTIKNLMITGGTGTQQYTPGSGFLPATTYARGGGIFLSASGGSLTLGKGAYVWKNTADPSSGSGTKLGYGGGIFINAPGELNLLDGSVVSDNGAESAGGGIAIYTISSTTSSGKLNIYDGAVIEKNHADGVSGYGGGIYLGVPVDVAMSGGRISGNTAVSGGGAIYGGEFTSSSTGTFTMTGGVIGDDSPSISLAAKYGDSTRTSDKSNKAGGSGGAFYFANASGGSDKFAINLYGGTIAYNCAANNGGAFYLKSGNLTVQGAQIKYNGATANSGGGGAIFLDERSKLHLDGCTIAGNECYGSAMGGAIYVLGDSDTARTPKTFLKGAVSIPSDGLQKNDICLKCYGNTTEWLKDPLLYIEGKLTGSEPVARVTIAPDDEAYYTAYRSNRQVLKLADSATDVNFALECYKFAVTPQASVTPAQEWAVGGDGYLTKVTTLTAENIADFSFANGDKVIIRVDCADADKIDSLMQKFYKSGVTSEVGDGSVLDLSKTNLTTLGISWSGGVKKQPNLDVIISPKVQYNQFTNQTAACALSGSKNIIVPAHSYTPDSYYLISIDGVVYTKDKKTLVCYPGGKTATSWSVPSGVTNIARYALGYNPTLKNVTLPDGLTTIEWDAFYSSTGLESINIPSSVTQIDRSFRAVSNLTSLDFANKTGWYKGSVTSENLIPDNAFATAASAATYYKENSLSSYKLVRE